MLGENRRPPATFRLRRPAEPTADSGRPSGGGRVPVTARLSKRFYDVFGEEIATELVDWFNAVDATYRADLRELNELNFARFDAKLEQRLATLDAAWQGRWTQLDAKLEQRLAELRVELVKELAGVKSGLKWMLAFWAPTALAVIGTGAGVISLLLRR